MELTHLFEQVSGSDIYRRQYDELQQAQIRAEEKVLQFKPVLVKCQYNICLLLIPFNY
jgi:hypothetical protein